MTFGALEGGAAALGPHLGYSARVADQPVQPQFPDAPRLPDSAAPVSPPDTDFEPEPKRSAVARPKSRAEAALPWVLAAVVVLILAVSGGLITAWLVATMHAVPAPVGAVATPTPSAAASVTPSGGPTEAPSDQPRHTPAPSSVPTQEPAPFVYVVQRGDSVTGIAQTFQVDWQDIVALNDLKPPKYRIFLDQQLLIPGYGVQPTPKPGHG